MGNLLKVLAGVALILATVAMADDIRSERVSFDRGANEITLKGEIKGDEIIDYVLGASRGQHMEAHMITSNASSYFNVMAPGEDDVAMFVGSVKGNDFSGTLPESGDYRLRVYLMRNAARREEIASYELSIEIRGDAIVHDPADATVAGTDYHATGLVYCSMSFGGPREDCEFGVTRQGYGNGIVTIVRPDGNTRTIYFKDGTAIGADTSEVDAGDFGAHREDDLTFVSIGDERYEIPDAVIYGG